MSREQYTPPALSGSQNTTNPGANTAQGGFNITGTSTFEDTSKPVNYLCGDCDTKVVLKKGDPIRCKECGYRVLYKERTNRCVAEIAPSCVLDATWCNCPGISRRVLTGIATG